MRRSVFEMRRPVLAIVAGTSWYVWNFRRNVVKTFVNQGWDVVVIAPADESTASLARIEGTTHHNWAVSLNGAAVTSEVSSLIQVGRAIRKYRPDFVLNNGIKSNVYSGLACRALGTPYANNVSGLGARMARKGLGAKVLARLYSFTSSGGQALLIQNTDDLDFLYANGLSRKTEIHRTMGSGVDLEYFAPTPLPDSSDRHFVFVGRLQRDKGIQDFIAAACVLHETDPGTRFSVVGDLRFTNTGGIAEEELGEWRKLPFVEFAGRQSDVRPWLHSAHALVMPSHGGEGMPKVILEAAACGRPVVTSNTPGCRDSIVEGKTGWLHEPGDVPGLVEAMQKVSDMSADGLEAIGHAARGLAEARYSDTAISELTLDLARAARKSAAI